MEGNNPMEGPECELTDDQMQMLASILQQSRPSSEAESAVISSHQDPFAEELQKVLNQPVLEKEKIEQILLAMKYNFSSYCKPKSEKKRKISKITPVAFWEHLDTEFSQSFRMIGFLEYQEESPPKPGNYIMLGPTVLYNRDVGQMKPGEDWCWDTPSCPKSKGRLKTRTCSMKDKSPLKREVYSLEEEEENVETTFKVVCISPVAQKKRKASDSGPFHFDGHKVGISSKRVYRPECDLDVEGAIKTQSLLQTSDERMKNMKGDRDPQELLEMAKKIQPKNFAYKNSPDEERLGFSAQEVQKAAPELVQEGKDGILALKLPDMSAMHHGAILALDHGVQNNKTHVEALQRDVNSMAVQMAHFIEIIRRKDQSIADDAGIRCPNKACRNLLVARREHLLVAGFDPEEKTALAGDRFNMLNQTEWCSIVTTHTPASPLTVAIDGYEPDPTNTFFKGYAWQLANCKCGQHVGWLFSHISGTKQSFWAIIIQRVRFRRI